MPKFFQVLALMRGRMHRLRIICIDICDEYCTMKFNQVEHFFNSTGSRSSRWYSRNNDVSIDAIIEALRSPNDGLQFNELEIHHPVLKICYEIVKSTKRLNLAGAEQMIRITKVQ
ncbi:hypothetical protein CAEBREN_08285 [Caenorhabditis brenneri]|uniref:Uncharacterized protein n=1 Tax=Caenorhabditis brenneri TaxID=135651 RepID=G0PDX4_CAEBE|nr:hypothetical protein CAEBREN_08285 [Caenorhabditis brenneri]